jgi:hypothetical protein
MNKTGVAVAASANAQNFTSEDVARRTIERRAIEAATWGMPIVSIDAMRQAFFRDAEATYGDIVYWSKPSDWKNQTSTPTDRTASRFTWRRAAKRPQRFRLAWNFWVAALPARESPVPYRV